MYLKNCKMLKIGEFLNENYTFYAHIDDNNKNKKNTRRLIINVFMAFNYYKKSHSQLNSLNYKSHSTLPSQAGCTCLIKT